MAPSVAVDQFILWFNMLTFVVMVAAAGLVYLVYLRSRHNWLRRLVVYTGAYASWLLFGTYVFFQSVFLPAPIESLTLIFAYGRVAVSFVILISGSLFYLELATGLLGARAAAAVSAVTAIIAILVVLVLGYRLRWAATVSTIVFNAYFSGLSAYALVMVLRAGGVRRRMLPFLFYSAIAYLLLAASTGILVLLAPASYRGIPVNVLASGLFSAAWGLLIVAVASRWVAQGMSPSPGELPPVFVEDHGISRREAEIVDALRRGQTSREIGERLFISERTVEAHIHNVYRKCRVNNRVELVNLISRYS